MQQGFTGGVELGKPSFQTLLQQRIWRQLEGWLAFTEERGHKLEALHCKVQQVQAARFNRHQQRYLSLKSATGVQEQVLKGAGIQPKDEDLADLCPSQLHYVQGAERYTSEERREQQELKI